MRKLTLLVTAALVAVVLASTPASAAGTTIAAAPTVASPGQGGTSWIEGKVTPAASLSKVVLQRAVDHKWVDRATGAVDSHGKFKIPADTSHVGTFSLRVRSPGGSVASPRFTLRVIPRPSITAKAVPQAVPVLGSGSVKGVVTPRTAVDRVVLQQWVYGDHWENRSNSTVDPKTGAYSLGYAPVREGVMKLRVQTPDHSTSSPTVYVIVTPKKG